MFKKILSCIITIFITICMLYCATNICERKASIHKYKDFFDQKEDFDVIFTGTSHVINAVFPMELWNNYGIVSYNFGGHSNTMATDYWVLKNVLDYTKPKLVVIDCFEVYGNTKTPSDYSYLHLSFDSFPLSINKIKAVFDLNNDPVMEEIIKNDTSGQYDRSRLELLWNYSIYHNRWEEIDARDILIYSKVEKGAESRMNVAPSEFNKQVNNDEYIELNTVSSQYLEKMIKLCNENNIDVLLTYLPFPTDRSNQLNANSINLIAKEYNVDYINFLNLNVINYKTDCYDDFSHLNSSGARKVSDYLGKYITNNYDIADNRNNDKYQNWYESVELYNEKLVDDFYSQENILNNLMLMYDSHFDYIIEINDKNALINDSSLDLLSNINIEINQIENNNIVIITNNGNNIEYDFVSNETNTLLDTKFGSMEYIQDINGINHDGYSSYSDVYLNGEYVFDSAINNINEYGVRFLVFDSNTKELLCVKDY